MDPVVHFEMPAENRTRMIDFYSKVFGWQMHIPGGDFGNYVTVTTIETGADGRPKAPGGINGGFYQKAEGLSGGPSIVIAVDDIKKSIKKVQEANGKILSEPASIPGIGLYVSFIDTEGNTLSMIQPAM